MVLFQASVICEQLLSYDRYGKNVPMYQNPASL